MFEKKKKNRPNVRRFFPIFDRFYIKHDEIASQALDHPQDFKMRVFAVGLTDSVHTMPKSGSGAKNTDYILKVSLFIYHKMPIFRGYISVALVNLYIFIVLINFCVIFEFLYG